MGGSVGIPCVSSFEGFSLIFSAGFLLNSCTEMKQDRNLRTTFVNYIKDGEWMNNLIENNNASRFSDELLLNRYSFHDNVSTMKASISKRVKSNASELTHDFSQLTLDEELPLNMKLFSNKVNCRAILLSILCSLYFKSPSNRISSKLSTTAEEFLFHAATMFDSDDLIAYLADPHSSFVNDLQDVLQNLPYHIIVSTSTTGTRTATATGNNSKTTCIIKYSNRDDYLPGIIGQNLHKMYIPDHVLLNNNNFKKILSKRGDYRAVLVEDNDVTLLAHVPLYDNNNMHIHTMFVESNSIDLLMYMDVAEREIKLLEHANQMEVLLSLLYVLIDY